MTGWQIQRHQELASTNDEAHRLALAGAAHGTVILTEAQTAGRGRRGHAWISPPGRNLLCSVLLRPDWPLEHWPRLTHIIALAIAETLEHEHFQPQIKWPNDLLIAERKVCGILLETANSRGGLYCVVGFGLNVNLAVEELPPDLQETATSLRIVSEQVWDRERLLEGILQRLASRAQQAGGDFASVLDAVRARSSLIGHHVRLHSQGVVREGLVCGLSAQGGLLFQPPGGGCEEILSADLVRRLSH